MMNYDIRVMFEKWMEKGYQLEAEGRFTLAINKYKDALEIAELAEDSAQKRAKEAIERCQNKIKERDSELSK